MRKNCLPFLTIMTLVLGFAGCGDNSESKEREELVLLCGSSFVEPANQLVEDFKKESGVDIITTSAGSEDFLPLVRTGQKGDILITHDPYLDYVKEAEKYSDHVHVGFVAPVLAVQPGNPKGLASIEDLTKDNLKVALSNPEYSTCGEMVFKLIEKKGIKTDVLQNVENRLTKGHSSLGTFLKTKTVDAVIMWNGVANTFKASLEVVPTEYEYDEEIRVHVIGLNYSKSPNILREFMDFVKTRGKETFAEHGYTK